MTIQTVELNPGSGGAKMLSDALATVEYDYGVNNLKFY